MNTRVETGYPLDNHRTTPIPAFAQFARAVHDSPNIDYLWLWDELSGWFPGKLWTTENTPAADFIDGDSTYDPFVQAAIALAHNPDANIRLSTDAIRGGPAELLRKVLTLSNATSGNVVVAVGAGELRQTKPFGYKRTEGLQRLEDILQLVRRLYDEPQPWTQETNFWHLKNATIGKHRPEKRPEFWALGGGPVLLDIAARYADGFEAATPQAIQTPEEFSETVEAILLYPDGRTDKVPCPGGCARRQALPVCCGSKGRASQARATLASVYERFSESFATTDLVTARALLGDL